MRFLAWIVFALIFINQVSPGFAQEVLPIQTDATYYTIFSERRNSQASDWVGWNIHTTSNLINGTDSIRFRYTVDNFFLRHEDFGNNSGVRFHSHQERVNANLSIPIFFSRVNFYGGLLSYNKRTYLEWLVSLSVPGPANGQYLIGRRDLKNGYVTEYLISDSRPVFSRLSKITGWFGQFGQPLFGDFQLGGAYYNSTDRPFLVNKIFVDLATYQLSDAMVSINYSTISNKAGFVYSSMAIKGKPEYTIDKGQGRSPFTFVNNGFFYSDTRKLYYNYTGFENLKTEISFVSKTSHLELNGYLESFPFTEGAVVLIGDYLFFDLNGTLEELALSATINYYFYQFNLFRFSSGWWRLTPELKIQTWEPVFFLIGRRNEETTGTDIRHLHIVPLSAGWEYRNIHFFLSAQVTQWIPVLVEKKQSSGTSGGSGGGSSDKPGTNRPKTTGGTFISVSAGLIL